MIPDLVWMYCYYENLINTSEPYDSLKNIFETIKLNTHIQIPSVVETMMQLHVLAVRKEMVPHGAMGNVTGSMLNVSQKPIKLLS